MIKGIRHHFFSGLLILGPLFLTLVVIGYLVRLTDRMVVDPLFGILPLNTDAQFKILLAKILIAILVFLFIALIGMVAEKFIFRQFLTSFEGLLKKIPLFSNVYSSIREIVVAFFGDKKGVFKSVVFIEYPRKGIYTMGFITLDKRWLIHEKTGKDLVSIFVPSPPNPATGNFVFVPREEVIETQISVEEGIRIVISGGAAVPEIK